MINLSSAMGNQFAEEMKEMTGEVKVLGPNPLREKVKSEK
jgi:coenzyme F420-reducing hydrogenase delta subunit